MQSIRWGEHSAHLTHSVSNLYRNSELTDCILDVEGESIHVHKIIIAACSPYFKKLLKKAHAIISIKDVSYKDMKLILDFIYYGEADVCITDVTSLMKTAELLEMTSLKHNICHCFQKDFSCMDTSDKCLDEMCSVPCTNLIGLESKNLMEEEVPYNPAILFMGEERLSFKSQRIHVDSMGDFSAKYLNKFRDVSGKSNKDPSKSIAPNTCDSFKKNTNQEKGNVNEELVPFTFVAVSEIKEANERPQDNLTCFDSVLKDPLGEYFDIFNVTEERSIKKEFAFQSELLVKKESKDDNDVPESMSEGVLISDKLTPSFHELTSTHSNPTESCDQESGMDRNPDAILSDTLGSEGFAPQKTLDLEIKYESICEISGADVKEEKVFETGQGLNHIVGDNTKSAIMEAKNELLNSCVPYTSHIDLQQVANEEDREANTSSVGNSFALEIGNKNPAMYKTPATSSVQSIFDKEKKKLKKMEENDSFSHDDDSLISKEQITFQPLVQRGALHLPFKPQIAVRKDQVRNVQTHSTKLIKFSCNICCKSYRKVFDLGLHMRTHTRQFHCERRKNSFDGKSHVAGLMRTHENDKRFGCSICNKTFGTKHYTLLHMRTHTGYKPFKCEICNKSFSLKHYMSDHMRAHTGDKPFECDICHKTFSSKHILTTHMRIHTGDKPFACEVCNKTFVDKRNLNVHMRTHTGEKPYSCDICNKTFSQKGNLTCHMRKHTGYKPFDCDICHKSFSHKQILIGHMRTHTREKPFVCEVCHKTFVDKRNLNVHMRTHTGEKPFPCDICNKTFVDKRNLNVHMRTHTGEKTLPCDICNKTFVVKRNLNDHMRQHTGDKPFECDICHKTFSLKHILIRHMRIHTGDKPFACYICNKTFAEKGNLIRHMRMHTGDKPFACEICNKAFSAKFHLIRHMRMHTGA